MREPLTSIYYVISIDDPWHSSSDVAKQCLHKVGGFSHSIKLWNCQEVVKNAIIGPGTQGNNRSAAQMCNLVQYLQTCVSLMLTEKNGINGYFFLT